MKAAPGDSPSPEQDPAQPATAIPAQAGGIQGPLNALTRGRLRPWHTLWALLLLGWTVSAADRAVTGPVVTWMIDNEDGDEPCVSRLVRTGIGGVGEGKVGDGVEQPPPRPDPLCGAARRGCAAGPDRRPGTAGRLLLLRRRPPRRHRVRRHRRPDRLRQPRRLGRRADHGRGAVPRPIRGAGVTRRRPVSDSAPRSAR